MEAPRTFETSGTIASHTRRPEPSVHTKRTLTLMTEAASSKEMSGHITRLPVAYPGILLGGRSTNSVENRGQRKRGSGGR